MTSSVVSFLVADPILVERQNEDEEEWDEEAVEGFDASKTYDDFALELQTLAKTASTDETSAEAAILVLDEMFRYHVVTERLSPDVHIYNQVLNVLAYSSANTDETALMIFDKLTNADDTTTPMANVATYATMMDLWMERDNMEESIKVFDTAISKENDVILWNKLIQAYGRAGAPSKSLQTFERMDVAPNEKTFVQLLRSQRSDKEALENVWENLTVPKTTELFNAYLFGQNDAKTCERILYGMIKEGMSPDAETIHQVLRAHATYGIPSLKLEQFLSFSKQQPIPDRTYALALQALSHHAHCARKAQKSNSILSRFANPPSVAALRSAIRSCATVPVDSYPEDKLEAFRIGMEIYQTAISKERLHGNALQLAANLLPPGSEKLDVLAKAIFAAATDDGTANAFCVAQFRRAASPALQLQVFGGDFDDLLQLPSDWSRNVDRFHGKQQR